MLFIIIFGTLSFPIAACLVLLCLVRCPSCGLSALCFLVVCSSVRASVQRKYPSVLLSTSIILVPCQVIGCEECQ